MKPILPVAIFSAALALAPLTYAQSSGVDEATPTAEEAPAESATPEAPVVEVAPAPVNVFGPAYLQMAQAMPFGLWENRLSETLRMYRLGLMSLADADEQFSELTGAAQSTAARLNSLTPPPQLAHEHQLLIAAASEYGASFEFGKASIRGNQAARDAANTHFLRAQDLAFQARQELR